MSARINSLCEICTMAGDSVCCAPCTIDRTMAVSRAANAPTAYPSRCAAPSTSRKVRTLSGRVIVLMQSPRLYYASIRVVSTLLLGISAQKRLEWLVVCLVEIAIPGVPAGVGNKGVLVVPVAAGDVLDASEAA